jgi:hypothetical protein
MSGYCKSEWDGLKVTAKAQELMKQSVAQTILGLSGVVVWEGDDSPEAYATIESMIDLAHNCGGRILRLDLYTVEQFNPENKGSISSGKYLYIPE